MGFSKYQTCILIISLLIKYFNSKDTVDPNKIKRVSQTLYIDVGVYFSRETLTVHGEVDEYYNTVLNHTQRAFLLHNVQIKYIFKEIFDEKTNTEVVNFDAYSLMYESFKNYSRKVNSFHSEIDLNILILSGKSGDFTARGSAEFGTICKHSAVIANVRINSSEQDPLSSSLYLSRYIGRALGLEFINDDCPANNNKCIMASIVYTWDSDYPHVFHTGSMVTLGTMTFSCLEKQNQEYNSIFEWCGDGIVNLNEECDCGFDYTCQSLNQKICCNPKTCMLNPSKECSDGVCCKDCMFSTGTVCRASANSECDIEEVCDGKSNQCPLDRTKPEGTKCNTDKYCVKGNCYDQQAKCNIIFGNKCSGGLVCYDQLAFMTSKCKEEEKIQMENPFCNKMDVKCSAVVCQDCKRTKFAYKIILEDGSTSCEIAEVEGHSTLTRETDGIACDTDSICLAGRCVGAAENIVKCTNIYCPAGMICKLGNCVRIGAFAGPCMDVLCAQSEFCDFKGECMSIIKEKGKNTHNYTPRKISEIVLYHAFSGTLLVTLISMTITFVIIEFIMKKKYDLLKGN